MTFNFTDRFQKVLTLSREEAIALQHDYVGTVHMLLGLLREGEGVAATALINMNVDLGQVRRHIEKTIRKGDRPIILGELPYTSRGKKALEAAMVEAASLNHPYVGTEHLLLGLLHEKDGLASKVLKTFGVTSDAAREEILRIVDSREGD